VKSNMCTSGEGGGQWGEDMEMYTSNNTNFLIICQVICMNPYGGYYRFGGFLYWYELSCYVYS
jgi:hypothetical protein